MSNSLQPHGLQHARLPCPSLSCRVCSNSCPLSRWCHPTVSISITPFSACPQFFPASRSFPVIHLFASGGQNIGASASACILPMKIWGWILLGLTSLNSLLSKGLSRVFSSTTVQKHQFSWHSVFFIVQLSYLYMTTGKAIALTIRSLSAKWCLCLLCCLGLL